VTLANNRNESIVTANFMLKRIQRQIISCNVHFTDNTWTYCLRENALSGYTKCLIEDRERVINCAQGKLISDFVNTKNPIHANILAAETRVYETTHVLKFDQLYLLALWRIKGRSNYANLKLLIARVWSLII